MDSKNRHVRCVNCDFVFYVNSRAYPDHVELKYECPQCKCLLSVRGSIVRCLKLATAAEPKIPTHRQLALTGMAKHTQTAVKTEMAKREDPEWLKKIQRQVVAEHEQERADRAERRHRGGTYRREY